MAFRVSALPFLPLALLAACTAIERPQVAAPVPPPVERAWGFDRSDVTRDPAIRYGVLPNGMRYAIQRNTTPLGSASIRLRIDMGSTAEADDQRGYAHFLEHMAFNGSRGVREGEMIKILERYGLAFGPDTNASTSYTETVYQLDLPGTDDAVVDTALMLMRETASELTLSQRAIDRERGVILSEKRARDQFGLRRLEHMVGFALPGTPVSKRLPIGITETIEKARTERLRDLYTRFYTPDRATLIVVGDIDPDAIEAKIRARFASWSGSGAGEGDPAAAAIDPARPSDAAYFRDPDVPASVSIMAIRPRDERPDSVAVRQETILRALGNAMLGRRLARIARQPDAAILGGSATGGSFMGTAEQAMVNINAKEDDWRGALGVGEQELRRAIEFGFTPPELAEQLANVRTGLENAARAANTRRSPALANALVSAIEQDNVVTTPAYRLELFEKMADRITPEAVNAAFRAQWAGVNPLIHVSGKGAVADARDTILAEYARSRAVPVAANADIAESAFAYTDFGAPGHVVADARIADLDIRTIRFANNVRLAIKKTDFEQDRVLVSLRVGGGSLEFPKDKPGLGLFMSSAFVAGGLEKHSLDELQSLTAGRAVTLGLSAGGEAFGGTVQTTPRDLEFQLQIFAAYMTAPGYRAEGDAQWQRIVPVFYDTLDASPAAIASRDLGRIIADGDPRFGIPPLADLKARSMAELKPVLKDALAREAIEIAIVGDIDEQAAIDMVARTFGALPEREAEPRPFAAERRITFPADRAPITLRHEGKADEAMLVSYWPTTDDSDFETDARLTLLAAVMRLMLTEELRETLGATYSPSALSSTSSTYPGYGQIVASSNLDPKDVARVRAATDRIAQRLRDRPVSADLLLRARRPILERLQKGLRENGTWLGLLDEMQSEPRWLDRFRAARATYEAVTSAELQALARRYLVPDAELAITIVAKDVATPN